MAVLKDDEEAIRTLFAEWKRASQAKDVDRLLSFITDDAVFLAPGQPPIRGKSAVKGLFRQIFGAFTFDQEWVFEEIAVFGDWGYCWGRDSVTMTPLAGGPVVRASGAGLSILRRLADGSWVVARGINNMVRETQPAAAASSAT
ncbi:MAG TPA: SgcJ/EcaC family oxidoreductase [Thermoanaerobaculia bacterium]|nr:SgcJ/EcaC family oxidoreductase [Thermoanaerobaculia bacterium]